MPGTTSLGLPTYAVGDALIPHAAILSAISSAANAAILSRTTMPHARVRSTTTTSAITTLTWTKVNMDVIADASAVQPWTMSTGADTLTINTAGLYALTAVVSTSVATFAVRIVADATTTLAQTSIGTTVSFTESVSVERRLTAGQVLTYEVYSTATPTVSPDAAATPCYLSVTRISD